MEEIGFLALTVAVELPVAVIVLRKISRARVMWAVLCVNMLTHPIAWLLLHRMQWARIEAGVTVAEMLAFACLFPACRKRAVAAALLMNVFSAGIAAVFF